MNDNYFTFRSVTTAMRGSRILETMGIASLTVRTPKQLQQQGCGYSLRVRSNAVMRAKQAKPRQVFLSSHSKCRPAQSGRNGSV